MSARPAPDTASVVRPPRPLVLTSRRHIDLLRVCAQA